MVSDAGYAAASSGAGRRGTELAAQDLPKLQHHGAESWKCPDPAVSHGREDAGVRAAPAGQHGRSVRDGVVLQEAVERTDFPNWRHVKPYGLNHRANVNFVYREQEYFR
jgi:hypothetical protein